MPGIQYYIYHKTEQTPAELRLVGAEAREDARRFHQGLPGYAPTPLVQLDGLARQLGVSRLWVKDESQRFGLNAFKALGGSYAIARWLGERLELSGEELTFENLMARQKEAGLGRSPL